ISSSRLMGKVSLANWVIRCAAGAWPEAFGTRRAVQREWREAFDCKCRGLSRWRNNGLARRVRGGQKAVARRPYGTINRSVASAQYVLYARGLASTFRFRFGCFAEHYCAFPREENHEETEQG